MRIESLPGDLVTLVRLAELGGADMVPQEPLAPEPKDRPLKDAHIPPGKGHFIYTSLLGTAKDLSTAENVQVGLNVVNLE